MLIAAHQANSAVNTRFLVVVQEAVIACPTKALGQGMVQDQAQEIRAADRAVSRQHWISVINFFVRIQTSGATN